jgi:hypothetical protein
LIVPPVLSMLFTSVTGNAAPGVIPDTVTMLGSKST